MCYSKTPIGEQRGAGMVNLVFGIEGDNLNPVIQELEFTDYDGRSILIPHQFSERILLEFLQILIHQNRVRHEETRISATRNSETRLFHLREIRYLESLGNLISISAEHEIFETYGSLTRIEKAISSYGFIRIHGSFLISVFHIKAYSARCVIMDDGKQINIGRRYIDGFRESIQSLHIVSLT